MAPGTGAIPTRSQRKTLSDVIHATTGENVGPGSYEFRNSYANLVPAPAPFCSSLNKNLMENNTTSAFTPGPGAYQIGKSMDALQRKHSFPLGFSSVFASSTGRLLEDKSSRGKPGPGQYDEGNAWIKHGSHRYQPPPSPQRVSYKRTPSAPSIPARNQSYGYEDTGLGQLVQQQPSEPIVSGMGRDTIGPGAYNLPGSVDPLHPKAVEWGKSGTKRGLHVTSITPGPGAYNYAKEPKPGNGIVVTINGVDVQFGGAQGTSNFASKVPLPTYRQDPEQTPGPGSYNYQQPLGVPPPKTQQFFGSTTVRSSAIDPTRTLASPTYYKTPGPGSYDTGKKGVSISQQCLTDTKPFNQTSSRFGPDANGVPGPGEYRPDLNVSLVKDVVDKAAVGKTDTFGSTVPRWTKRDEQVARSLPGPGNYNASIDMPKPRRKGPDASFVSASDRWRAHTAPPTAPEIPDGSLGKGRPIKGDPTALGPGKYTTPDPWVKQGKPTFSYRKPAFGSDVKQHQMPLYGSIGGGVTTPGPGRYNSTKDVDKAFKPLTVPSKDTVFGSQVSRFKTYGPFTPGPGQYSVGSDLTRRSHNITYQPVQ